jgi:hypothetical protein
MAVDQAGRVYLAGRAGSADFPPTPPSVERNGYRDVFFASIDEVGRLQSLTLIPTATEQVPATDVAAFPKLLAPRPDGYVFVLGGYRSDNLLRAGAFRALVDGSGATRRAPELLDLGEGDGSFVEASVAGERFVYFVKMTYLAPNAYARWLLRTRIGPPGRDTQPLGNSREKR